MNAPANQPLSTVDEYISSFPPNVQTLLERIRTCIRAVVPEAEETIKYRMPTYILRENLVHFAAFKNHIGFYPTPSGITEFQQELSTFQNAKGSVQFPLSQPIPIKLIEKIVRFRVQQVKKASAALQKKKQAGTKKSPVSKPRAVGVDSQ